jgi:hypothetical protein
MEKIITGWLQPIKILVIFMINRGSWKKQYKFIRNALVSKKHIMVKIILT